METSDWKLLIGTYTYGNDGLKTESFGNYHAWILKLGSTDALEWEKSFGGLGSDQPRALYELEDCYVVGAQISYFVGNTLGVLGGTDFWVFKIDFNGNFNLANYLWWNKK